MNQLLRNWCAVCRFPGRAKFYLGTVQAETEMTAMRAALALADELFPTRPEIVAAVPGTLAFVPEGGE